MATLEERIRELTEACKEQFPTLPDYAIALSVHNYIQTEEYDRYSAEIEEAKRRLEAEEKEAEEKNSVSISEITLNEADQ